VPHDTFTSEGLVIIGGYKVIAVFMLIPCAVPLIVTATDFVTLDETASKAAD